MQSNYVNPFLESSILVIEQMCQIRPALGELKLKSIPFDEGILWLQIRIIGDLEGDIVFSFPMEVALKLVSVMMGGFAVTEIDEMSKSALSELGNMISGNASSLLFDQGITIDITPPRMVDSSQESTMNRGKALNIPLKLSNIGELEIYVNVKNIIRVS